MIAFSERAGTHTLAGALATRIWLEVELWQKLLHFTLFYDF